MSALLRKEIRLLLPSFSIALLLTFSAWLVPRGTDSASGWLVVFPFLLCPAMAVMTALDSFGREISSGTLSNLLSQPIQRSRIWWIKTALLAAALVIVLSAWWLSILGHSPFNVADQNLRELAFISALIALTAFSGGLWTVLLFRQVPAAFWFTILIPAALAVSTMYLTEKLLGDSGMEYIISVVLVVYSTGAFFAARRMFLRAQDVQWTGGEVAMPGWLKMPRFFVRSRTVQGRRPRSALLVKEFQLHQSQFVIAGALLVLHLGMIAARKMGDGFKESPALEFLTGQFWILWVVMPLLIACAAAAEERKLGTLEAQLCLPARRRTQFLIKCVVMLVISVVFGVVVPVILEGPKDFPDMFLPLFGIVTGTAAISFYASTLARNTLQALAPAVLGIIVTSILVLNGSYPEVLFGYPLWRGWLAYLIGVPVVAATLALLSYGNFKRVLVGWAVLRRNALACFAALLVVVVFTSATYHRAWELFTPIEPPHAVARFTRSQNVSIGWSDRGSFIARLPSGRIWMDRLEFKNPSFGAMLFGNRRNFELLHTGRLVDGTNWSSFAVCNWWDEVGVKEDGSLWVSERTMKPFKRSPSGQLLTSGSAKLARFGKDKDWKRVVQENGIAATLLKSDGTLWRLGTNRFDWKKPWPGLRAFKLQRLGADSDWMDIVSNGNQPHFRKSNGEAWRFAWKPPSAKETAVTNWIHLDDETWLYRMSNDELFLSRGDVLASFHTQTYPNMCMVGVRQDGTFRITGTWQHLGRSPTWTIREQDIQLGKETNWIAVAGGSDEPVVTLKSDGSLWKWTFSDDPKTNPDAASCVRLGTHSDWVAVTSIVGNIVSLAADGSLWCWQFEPLRWSSSQYNASFFETWPLLGTSRKPEQIASIFDEAK